MGSSLATLRRTVFLQAVTRLPHDRVRAAVALSRSDRPAALALAPVRWWLRRGPVRIRDGPGAGLELVRADVVASHVQAFGLVRGTLELPVQEALRRTLGAGGILFDVGANIGFFSLLGARLAGPGGRVFAFEPHPVNADVIAENAHANGLANIAVFPLALGARAGSGRLIDVQEPSWSHLASYGEHPLGARLLSVEVATLDGLLEEDRVPPPTVIKLDVEGAELDILDGAERILTLHRPVVVCELHATNSGFAERMEDAGYRIENLDGAEPIREARPDAHVLAVPAEAEPGRD